MNGLCDCFNPLMMIRCVSSIVHSIGLEVVSMKNLITSLDVPLPGWFSILTAKGGYYGREDGIRFDS